MENIDVDKVVHRYLAKRRYDLDRYQNIKDDPQFKAKNNLRAKRWYEKNREKRLELYDKNKEVKCAYQQLTYYKKKDRLTEFVLKFPGRWKVLLDHGKLSDEDKRLGSSHYFPEDPDTESDDEYVDPETQERNPNFVY